MNYEIFSVLEISTAHITEQDGNLLEASGEAETQVVAYSTEYGWQVYCQYENEDELFDYVVLSMKSEGYSDEMINLMKLGRQLGCRYLGIDQDGMIYDNLPQFGW